MKVLRIDARSVMVPLRRPPQSASGAIPEAPIVLIDLHGEDGLVGRSYIFTFTRGMLAPTAGCVRTLGAMVEGDVLAPLALEAKLQGQAGSTRDFKEGVMAFLEKRKPSYEGR